MDKSTPTEIIAARQNEIKQAAEFAYQQAGDARGGVSARHVLAVGSWLAAVAKLADEELVAGMAKAVEVLIADALTRLDS